MSLDIVDFVIHACFTVGQIRSLFGDNSGFIYSVPSFPDSRSSGDVRMFTK